MGCAMDWQLRVCNEQGAEVWHIRLFQAYEQATETSKEYFVGRDQLVSDRGTSLLFTRTNFDVLCVLVC